MTGFTVLALFYSGLHLFDKLFALFPNRLLANLARAYHVDRRISNPRHCRFQNLSMGWEHVFSEIIMGLDLKHLSEYLGITLR